MSIINNVTVNITLAGGQIPATSYDIPLILTNGTGSGFTSVNEVRSYSNLGQVAADFGDHQFPYHAAAQIFAQPNCPKKIKVALLPTPATGQAIAVDVTACPSGTNLTGSLISPHGSSSVVLASFGANHAALAANLNTSINTFLASGISASVAGNVVTTAGQNDGQMWHLSFQDAQGNYTEGLSIMDKTDDWAYDDQLTNIKDIDNDWYCVIVDNNSPKNISKIAAWCASDGRKISVFSPQVTVPSDWTSADFAAVADHTALLENDRAVIVYTKRTRLYPLDAALFGNVAYTKGEATWAFKNLRAIGADVWTQTEADACVDAVRAGNIYVSQDGTAITFEGKATSGQFADITVSIDRIIAELEARLRAAIRQSPKIPFTNAGIGALGGVAQGALNRFVKSGILDGEEEYAPVVTVPDLADLDAADIAARRLNDLTFTARLAGAIHAVTINGTISLS
jgi:phage tail sheath gpL-like